MAHEEIDVVVGDVANKTSLPANVDSEKECPTSAESLSGGEIDSSEDIRDDDAQMARQQTTDSTPSMTISKAKAIALVATVTGASFLNVSTNPVLLFNAFLFPSFFSLRARFKVVFR